ncbi:outer membrane receptor for ferric coprogen and ferric-rhodotorulic acid [Halomonas fontilapidosi]|uniref:Outer membrane receptor for ferric coprogen and ferric-rhodotorulic acid n=1 Tax=Halomonas fontilapidosi TaxID=616675 RepID=A0A7W5GZJ5_9GAMM|nr:TonB-dependent siderophore receptor [Halomonas fontilapidosi]MBB3184251.1 outer membrane receptor for ferric coprogen and ferric-rhodotorulic acid [Halomonas fontilapidosi]
MCHPDSLSSRIDPLAQAVRRALGLATAGAFVVLSPASFAQEAEPAQALETVTVEAEALSIITEGTERYRVPLTSSATRLDLTPRETPQSVSTVTRAQMDDFNLDTTNDVLESTPGVTVERLETDRTYYTARGFEISNFQVDGLRVPMPYNNVHGDMDTAIYDRVEVVRGATGLMSGSGNPAATVNFVRKRPTYEPQASVSASVGSWEQRRLEADVAGPLDDAGRLRGRLVAAGMESDSYLDRLSRERGLLYGVLEADVTDSTLVTLGHTWQQNNTDGNMWGSLPLYDSAGDPTGYDVETSSAPDWSYWDVETRRSFLEVQQELGERWSLKGTLTHLDMLSDTQLFYIYGTPDASNGRISDDQLTLSRYDRHLEQWVADLHAKGDVEAFGRTHQLVVGTDWSQSRNQQLSRYPTADFDAGGQGLPPLDDWNGDYPEPDAWVAYPTTLGDATVKERSLYGAAKLDLAERWTAVAGARLSWADAVGEQYGSSQETDVDNELTPYAGLIYDVTDWTSLYASYTEIFDPQTEINRNGDFLDPVEGASYELGFKASVFDGAADASLALFRTEQDNLAQPAGTRPDGTAIYKGGDGITSEGVEVTLAGELAPGWQASVGYTYLEIEDADGEATNTYIPRHLVRATTSYRPAALDALKVGARLRWQDDIERDRDFAEGKTRQEGYALVDLMASYDFSDNLTGSLNLNNVTDEAYLTSLKWDQAFRGAPRHVMANLTWRY